MQQDLWGTVNEIFHAALELPAEQRRTFVTSAANGAPSLLSELEDLLAADAAAGSYLESPLVPNSLLVPLAPPPPVAPGDLLCSRFRILRPLGEGGMGHVFEALDLELGVHVALKIIRSEIASTPEAIARFRQEVRLARRITHPNVCRIYDLSRAQLKSSQGGESEYVFLTMEYLEGETLAAKIKREGALGIYETIAIAEQIAAALSAAHALGIIHRDIKPGNIMLVPRSLLSGDGPRAVITDFGLARLDPVLSSAEFSSLSHSNRPLGTLAYMAPEQLEGKPVSSATDIYALGLVLYEMVTGYRAFPSQSLLGGIAQRLGGTSPSPEQRVPDLPHCISQTIETCLRIAPEERFQSVSEIIPTLKGATPPAVAPARSVGKKLLPWLSPRRFLATSVIVLATMSLSWGGSRLYRSRTDAKVTPGALVYLAPVKNLTGERSLDNTRELLQAGLIQSAHINLLDQSRVGDILQQMTKLPDTTIEQPIAREVAMRAGAVRVIFVTVSGSHGNYQLDIDIQQPDNTPKRYRNHWERNFAWKNVHGASNTSTISQELSTSIREASDWIRYQAGESSNDIARLDIPPEDVTTQSWDALENYAEATELARTARTTEAIARLQQATQFDPDFALAYARKGDLLLSVSRDVEGYKAYKQALSASLKGRLTRREEDRIKGMQAIDTADYSLAVKTFEDYELYYKEDYLGWVYPTQPLRMLKRDNEAIDNLRHAIALAPEKAFAPLELAKELIIENKLDEATYWAKFLRSKDHPEAADEVQAILAEIDKQYDEAFRIFRLLQNARDPLQRSYGYLFSANLSAHLGKYSEAIEFLNQGIDQDLRQKNDFRRGDKLLNRAYLQLKTGAFDRALQDIREGIGLDPSPRAVLLADTILGNLMREAPRRYALQIKQLLLQLLQTLPVDDYGAISTIAKLRTRGEYLLASGNYVKALETFRLASAKDAPAASREYLARALVIAARNETNKKQVLLLLQQAQEAYRTTLRQPATVWCYPAAYPPGFLSDLTESFAHLTDMINDLSPPHLLQQEGATLPNPEQDL